MDTRDRHRTTTTITTAAQILGLSVETLRKRLQRGSIDGYKAEDGTWRVVLDMSGADLAPRSEPADGAIVSEGMDEVLGEVQALREQVATLAEALRDLAIILQEMHGRIMREPAPAPHGEAEDLDWPLRRAPAGDDDGGEALNDLVLSPTQARLLLKAVLEVVERQGRGSGQA